MAEGTERQPVVDMKNRKIVRIGIVVADVRVQNIWDTMQLELR